MRAYLFERFLNETKHEWHREKGGGYSVHCKEDKHSWIQVPGHSARFSTGEPTPLDMAQLLCASVHGALFNLAEKFPKGIQVADVPRMTEYLQKTDLFSKLIRWRMENGI